ncbi:hypothetical protein [Allonocardiopsis opalescens]|uniref:Pterin-binding domain-containing protein n=1 Tax=Allonocardiopsis opalescens TaxID=1144618 RepID=A0A2T0QDD5_9ACTN|nr:hypothetical protein [Allonocardiopsis opalescens]PRY01966.1 hypothetical protein CLV72_101564 [Allonocardiopsis opalescens]
MELRLGTVTIVADGYPVIARIGPDTRGVAIPGADAPTGVATAADGNSEFGAAAGERREAHPEGSVDVVGARAARAAGEGADAVLLDGLSPGLRAALAGWRLGVPVLDGTELDGALVDLRAAGEDADGLPPAERLRRRVAELKGPVVVDADEAAAAGGSAALVAMVTVSAWLGAAGFVTARVRQVRRAVDMVAAVRGITGPAVARRGLA